MKIINVSDLAIAGSDLFQDSETYLKELSEHQLNIRGGYIPPETEPTIVDRFPNTLLHSPLCMTPLIR